MSRHHQTLPYFRPALSLAILTVGMTGCARQMTTSPSTSPTTSAGDGARKAIADAGKKAAQALFSEIGPPPFSAVQNTSTDLPLVTAVRPVTLADLPKPSFALNTVEKGIGPGVIVFEPVLEEGTDSTLGDFAAGCSDWLFFTVGGQPQMGQTPLFTSVARAQRELKLTKNLRLGPEDARRVAAITGASHVIVGKVASTGPDKGTLTYTLYSVETGKPVGKGYTLSGNSETMRRQLPQVAVSLSKQLGVSVPQLPSQTDATPADLRTLGRVVWTESPQSDDIKAVSLAAPRVALADLCKLTQERFASGTQFKQDAALLLTKLAPQNTLAWGHAAYMNAAYLTPLLPNLTSLRQHYPRNYALAHTDVWMNRQGGTAKGERRAAEDAVQSAPRNPDAWLSFGWTVSQEAHKLRGGRFANNISSAEWRSLYILYPLWEKAITRATKIDPQHTLAWTRLAEAATFSGNHQAAEDAFWKAETYSDDKFQVFEWGLQMFQEKWGGQKTDLNRVAQDAAMASYDDTKSAGRIANVLRGIGYTKEADELLNRLMASAEKRLAQDPNDAYAHWDKGSLLYFMGRKPAACREYEVVTKLLPQSVVAQYAYAETLLGLGADVRSIPEYQRVLELDPQNADAPLRLGSGFKHNKQWAEAEKWYKVAIARLPNDGNAHLALAELYQWYGGKRRHAEAAQEYARCMELGGDAPIVYAGRTFALADSGKASEAVHWGEEALNKYGGDLYSEITDKDRAFLRGALGYAYMKSKRYPEAMEQGEAVLKMAPNDPNAHELLGDTYNALGRRSNARKSWNIVVTTVPEKDDPEGVGHARKMLAKNPENGT
jgi:tetratricopeptide (TPR) repeat protein